MGSSWPRDNALGPDSQDSSLRFLSQSLHGCETGDRRDANTCPQRLHEGKAGLGHVAPGRGQRAEHREGPRWNPESGFGNGGWLSCSDGPHLQSLKTRSGERNRTYSQGSRGWGRSSGEDSGRHTLSLLVERRIGSNACPKVPTVSWEYRQMKNGLYNRDMANQAPSFLI